MMMTTMPHSFSVSPDGFSADLLAELPAVVPMVATAPMADGFKLLEQQVLQCLNVALNPTLLQHNPLHRVQHLNKALDQALLALEYGELDNTIMPQALALVGFIYQWLGNPIKTNHYLYKALALKQVSQSCPASTGVIKGIDWLAITSCLYHNQQKGLQSHCTMGQLFQLLPALKPWPYLQASLLWAGLKHQLLQANECVVNKQWPKALCLLTAVSLRASGFFFWQAPWVLKKQLLQLQLTLLTLVGLDFKQTAFGALKEQVAKALAKTGHEGFAIHLATLYQQESSPLQAVKCLKRSLRRNPNQPLAYYQLAQAYVSLHRVAKAIDALKQTLLLQPTFVEARTDLACIYQTLGQHDNATEQYQLAYCYAHSKPLKRQLAYALASQFEQQATPRHSVLLALQLKLEQEPTPTAATLSQLARYANQQNWLELALYYCQLAEPLAGKTVQCDVNRAFTAWLAGYTQQAYYHYQKALSQQPNHAFAHNNLGALLLDTEGDVTAAMAHFEKAIEHYPTYAMAYYNLGRAHSRLNNPLQAATAFVKAKELNTVSQELDLQALNQYMSQLYEQL
jgi:tetratricopeptide (TPR) repeat protein